MTTDRKPLVRWSVFWPLWLTGLTLFMVLVAGNGLLVTSEAPHGIIDHQSAGTAARVDAIRGSWRAAGVDWFATVSMLIDLVFISAYAAGGGIGATLVARSARSSILRGLAWALLAIYVLFAILDFGETLSEIAQQLAGRGVDGLAAMAAALRPIKMQVFLAATVGTAVSLAWHRLAGSPRSG